MKKNILFLTLGILIGCLIMPLAINADSPIRLVVNGNSISCDQPPVIMNGRILVPVRAVSDALGCDISWDQPTRTVTVTQKNIVSSPVKTDPVQITPEKDNPKPVSSNTNSNTTSTDSQIAIKETTFNGLRAIEKDGQIYFSLSDYISKATAKNPNNSITNDMENDCYILTVNNKKISIPYTYVAGIVYNSTAYINSKYYVEF